MNTPLPPQIFDKKLLEQRTKKIAHDDFLRVEIKNMLDERINDIPREFGSSLTFERDAEFLDHEENNFDLVKSSLAVHWVNDVRGLFFSAKRILKPNGFFISNFLGGQTLKELRQVFSETDSKGLSPRLSPMIDVKDSGKLLQIAGFEASVADSDKIEVSYTDIFALMKHLKRIGENNALIKRRQNFTGKGFMQRANEIYKSKFSDNEGRIIATFEVVTVSGWKPKA